MKITVPCVWCGSKSKTSLICGDQHYVATTPKNELPRPENQRRAAPLEVQTPPNRDKPEKPIIDDPFSEAPLWNCPLCEDSFLYNHDSHTMNFCPTCGQRLDWSNQ